MEHQHNLHSKKYCKQRCGEFSLGYAWTREGGPSEYVRLPGASALQRATADTEAEIERTNRGLVIRRAKKRINVISDARIKTCITRYDNGSCTRLQFLRAVSHSVGAQCSAITDVRLDSDSESEDEPADQPAVPAPPQDDRNNDGSILRLLRQKPVTYVS